VTHMAIFRRYCRSGFLTELKIDPSLVFIDDGIGDSESNADAIFFCSAIGLKNSVD